MDPYLLAGLIGLVCAVGIIGTILILRAPAEMVPTHLAESFGLPPRGSFRVACSNLVEVGGNYWLYGDHDDLSEAQADADEHSYNDSPHYICLAFVYNSKGRIVYQADLYNESQT